MVVVVVVVVDGRFLFLVDALLNHTVPFMGSSSNVRLDHGGCEALVLQLLYPFSSFRMEDADDDDDDVVIIRGVLAPWDHSLRICWGEGGDPTGIHWTVDPIGTGWGVLW